MNRMVVADDRLRAWSDAAPLTNVAGTVTVRPTNVDLTSLAASMVMVRDGRARGMWARVDVAPGANETITFTLIRIRGVTVFVSALSVVIAGAAVAGQNLTDSVPCLGGDEVQIRATRSGGAAAPLKQRVGVRYV